MAMQEGLRAATAQSRKTAVTAAVERSAVVGSREADGASLPLLSIGSSADVILVVICWWRGSSGGGGGDGDGVNGGGGVRGLSGGDCMVGSDISSCTNDGIGSGVGGSTMALDHSSFITSLTGGRVLSVAFQNANMDTFREGAADGSGGSCDSGDAFSG